MTRIKTASAVIAALLAIVPASGSVQEKPLTPLRIATLKIAAQTDVWVAQQRGIYARNGIDAKISFFNTGAESIPAMQGGAVDVLLSIPGIGMLAMERGIDIAAIFQDEIAHATPPDSASVQVLESSGPAVLAAAADAAAPRVPGMKDLLAAGKKPVELLELAALKVSPPNAVMTVTGRARPERKARQGQLIDTADPAKAAAELVTALRQAGAL